MRGLGKGRPQTFRRTAPLAAGGAERDPALHLPLLLVGSRLGPLSPLLRGGSRSAWAPAAQPPSQRSALPRGGPGHSLPPSPKALRKERKGWGRAWEGVGQPPAAAPGANVHL